ncbi:hypothetical protein PoB_006463300 [Plakobranchus ocellatus]|uniref:Uncharacterized protein n=1 Tax=Plakobranchus ocellatus TaxID=259542 RepID=A0AAV4D1U4_9GAST|nr:hypothetical protein PoB_006463300 [Plakobranchus ocellatus]
MKNTNNADATTNFLEGGNSSWVPGVGPVSRCELSNFVDQACGLMAWSRTSADSNTQAEQQKSPDDQSKNVLNLNVLIHSTPQLNISEQHYEGNGSDDLNTEVKNNFSTKTPTESREPQNNFYMELMGQYFSARGDKYDEHDNMKRSSNPAYKHCTYDGNKASSNAYTPCSSSIVDQSKEDTFSTNLMDGERIQNSNGKRVNTYSSPRNLNNQYNDKDNPGEHKDLLSLFSGTDDVCCASFEDNGSAQASECHLLNESSQISGNPSRVSEATRNKSSDRVSETPKQNGYCPPLMNTSADVGGRDGDGVYVFRNLSVIEEEAEDIGHEESADGVKPCSELLPNNSTKTLTYVHSSGSSRSRLNDVTINMDSTDPGKVITLTLPKDHDAKNVPSGFMVVPLFHIKTKLTRKQAIHVAALMLIGFIFVLAILAWVFSPVILDGKLLPLAPGLLEACDHLVVDRPFTQQAKLRLGNLAQQICQNIWPWVASRGSPDSGKKKQRKTKGEDNGWTGHMAWTRKSAAVKDRDLWRDMIANAYKQGT